MTVLISSARRGVGAVIRRGMRLLPQKLMSNMLGGLTTYYARALPAADGLRFLFTIDKQTYHAEGKLAILYDDGIHTKHRHMKYHDFFVDHVQTGEHVLDIGCGNGALSQDIAERGEARVTGMDLEERNILLAQTNHAHPRATYLVGDALTDLPESETVDVIVLSNVLEHIDERVVFLEKIANTYHPRIFLIRVPTYDRDWRIPLQNELGLDYRLDPTHFIEYTEDKFRSEAAQAGLQVDSLRVIWGEIWSVLSQIKE